MEENPDHDRKLDMLVVSRVLEAGRHKGGIVQPMFCQMNQLKDSGTDIIWVQVARWVKFEEYLDEDANRWSKPHVPSLSLNSLCELRKELRHVPVLLNPDVTDFKSLIDKLTSSWVSGGYLEPTLVDGIKMVLLKPTRHVHEGKLPRPASSNLLAVNATGIGGSSVSLHSMESYASARDASPYNSNEDLSADPTSPTKGTPKTPKKNVKFQRKVPKNAVATNILIGELTCLRRPLMALVRLDPSRHLGWLCEVRLATQFLFVCLTPEATTGVNLNVREMGRCIGGLMIDPIFRELADKASTRFEILAGITEFVSTMTGLPSCVWNPKTRIEPPASLPSQDFRRVAKRVLEERRMTLTMVESHSLETEDDGLRRTGRMFGGLVDDIKRKWPWYASDFKDCLHIQCIASTIFLFLATLTPNITFGGLLGQGTDQYMGTMECILAASICGVVFALFAGQPLNILGSTGPMLILEVIIFKFCKDQEWDFLPFRVWVGLWTCAILVVFVAFDLSALVKYITRFTEECFACLVAMIFIYEAIKKTININSDYALHTGSSNNYPTCDAFNNSNNYSLSRFGNLTYIDSINTTYNNNSSSNSSDDNGDNDKCDAPVPDVFLLSLIEFVCTFVIAFALVKFRNSIYFPNVVRRMLSDFGVLIAIIIVVGVDVALNIDTPKLQVPEKFSPSRSDRPWFISPVSDKNPWWLAIAAILPAILSTILVFMDQQITAVIVNRKQHKLKKGGGYHLDILVIAVLIVIMSILGLPWYVAATVSALAHVMSLKVESDCTAPGEKPEFLGVREQRVTGLVVGLLSGLSILFTGVLKLIPLPVLYGVFLFMGIRALDGMQLVERFMLYFVSPKYQPDYPVLRHVPLLRVHVYTLIQVICLAALWIVKTIKATSVGFPIMVLATCFIRKLLDSLFTQYELSWLDHLLPSFSSRSKHKFHLGLRPPQYQGHHRKGKVDVPHINVNDPTEMEDIHLGNDDDVDHVDGLRHNRNNGNAKDGTKVKFHDEEHPRVEIVVN